MDHSEALRLQAAEKYVLGELPPQLRDEYEDHYFDCQECADDVKAAVTFVGGSRTVFGANPAEVLDEKEVAPRNWLAWLRPAVLVPAMAVLIALLGYQNLVTIPHLQRATSSPTAGSAGFISLIGTDSRGEGPAKSFAIHRNQPVVLEVDITSPRPFPTYLCQIQDALGRVVHAVRVSAADAKHSVHLIVPSDALQARAYTLRILGQDSEASQPVEVAKFTFTLEFLP